MVIEDPIEELKKTRLWNYLNSINSDFASKGVTFVRGISDLLLSIKKHFPYYTRHDAHHGYRVLLRMEQILLEDCFCLESDARLIVQEAYLLICAAYAHDLGMTVFPDEEDELLTHLGLSKEEGWEVNPKLQEHLRKNHSSRGGQYIKAKYEELGIPLNLVSLLHELMKSHNLSIHELEVKLGIRVAVAEKEIDLRQLACIVCISDAIEFSDTRVIEGVLDKLINENGEAEKISFRENMKHVCIGDSVAVGSDGRIIFSGTFVDPDILNLAHKTIDLIESWIRQYCDIDYRAKAHRLRLKSDFIIRNLKIIGVDFERLGIRIKKENIINLIASNSTWANDSSMPLKELLQNSVEACRYRDFNTPASRAYQPVIKVTFDKENRHIIISDNGCGMSKNIILNNFLTVGNSRASDPVYKSFGYNSLARFGIGFWSVFTISSQASIETAPFELLTDNLNEKVDGYKFTVNIEEFKDYTVFQPERMNVGTKIILKIKENISIDDILAKLENIIICSEIPIEVTSSDGVNFDIPLKLRLLEEKEVFGAKRKFAEINEVKLYNWVYEDFEIQFTMGMAYRLEDNQTTFLLKDQQSSMLFVVQDSLRHVHGNSAICGFTVGVPIRDLPLDISRVGYFIANILNPKGFSYILDRKVLLPTQEVEITSRKIMNLVCEGYRNFLKENNSYNSKCICEMNMQSRMHGGNVFDSYTGNKLYIGLNNYPDLVCFKLYKVSKDVPINQAEVTYVNINELMEMNGIIWTCQTSAYSKQVSRSFGFGAEKLVPIVFEFVNRLTENDYCDNYVIEPCIEGSMLFDNNSDSEVYSIVIEHLNKFLPTNILKIPIKSLRINETPTGIIGEIKGKWTGTIYEKTLHSQFAMFEFMGRYRVVINKGSTLAQVIKEKYANGRFFELAEFIRLLEEAGNGYVDDKVKKYIY